MDVRLTGHGVEQFATRRLIGRRLLPADTGFLSELHQDSDVMALQGGAQAPNVTGPFVRANVAHWRRYQFGLYILATIDEPDVPIGRAGLRWDRSANGGPAVDASVTLAKPMWGQGIASEALRAVVAVALDRELPLVAGSAANHAAARRVMEKVGFVYGMEFLRQDVGWVRYQWPAAKPAPAAIADRAIRQ